MIIHVKVKPNSKIDSIYRSENNELHVRIRAVPVDGKANKYLAGYLAKVFKVPGSSVVILKGLNNAYKTIEIIADDQYINNTLRSLQQV